MRVVDVFSGCGGMSLGFEKAGYEVVAAFDNWEKAGSVYEHNFQHPFYLQDLEKLDEYLDTIRKYNPDMIIGGPPCQDFSPAGLRDESRGRAGMTSVFAEIVEQIKPEWFVMENVPNLQKSKVWPSVKESFTRSGYGLTVRVLNAALCGVPQNRKRVFVIGHLGGADNELGNIIDESLAKTPMTLRDYFGDSLGIKHYFRMPTSYKRRAVFSIDEPSPTIRGVHRPIPPGYKKHPNDTAGPETVRPLTSLERAQVQTFPPEFTFFGSNTAINQMVGNAVPVNLARFVGEVIEQANRSM